MAPSNPKRVRPKRKAARRAVKPLRRAAEAVRPASEPVRLAAKPARPARPAVRLAPAPERPASEPVRLAPEPAWPVPEPVRLAGEPARPAPEPPAPTYISPGIKVKGEITAQEDLYIEGEVQGSVSIPGHRLTVGERAYVRAETVAREVVVYGAMQGGLLAWDRIEIKKHASVDGDLATAEIVIEDGAHVKGVIESDARART